MFRVVNCLRHGIAIGPSRSFSHAPKAVTQLTVSTSTLLSNNGKHYHGCQCCRATNFSNLQQRNLFTDVALGIEKLDRVQEKKRELFSGPNKDRYIERLNSYFQNDNVKSIIKDDLINLLGIAESDEDLDLLEKVVCCTETSQDDLLDGWGASMMRLYYKLNKVDRALENIKNIERFGRFFNHRICYKIVMTMLYDAGRYNEVIDLYKIAEQTISQPEGRTEDDKTRSNYDLITLTFAALAKLNNKQALEMAEKLFVQLNKNPLRKPGLRPASFLAYLAVNNDDPNRALNTISTVKQFGYISLRELKILSLIKLGRYEDILLQIREFNSIIRRDSTVLLRSTLTLIEQNINNITDENLRQELNDILAELQSGGHISDATIEELIFKPIESERQRPGQFKQYRNDQRYNSGPREYNNNNYNNNNYRYNRGGERYQSHDRYQDGEGRYQNDDRYQSGGGDRRQAGGSGGYRQRPRYNNQDRDRQRANDEDADYGGRDSKRQFTYQNMTFD